MCPALLLVPEQEPGSPSGAEWVPSVVGSECTAPAGRAAGAALWDTIWNCTDRVQPSSALPWKGYLRSHWGNIGVSARHPSHHLKVLFFLHPLCSAESYWHLGCLSYDHRVRWNKCYPSAPFHVVVFVCSVVWLWVWWEWWASHSGKRNVRHCVCRTRSEQSSQNCN